MRWDSIARGEMAEWSIAAVLKTVEGQPSQGSNPCLSAKMFIIIISFTHSIFLISCITEYLYNLGFIQK